MYILAVPCMYLGVNLAYFQPFLGIKLSLTMSVKTASDAAVPLAAAPKRNAQNIPTSASFNSMSMGDKPWLKTHRNYPESDTPDVLWISCVTHKGRDLAWGAKKEKKKERCLARFFNQLLLRRTKHLILPTFNQYPHLISSLHSPPHHR